MKHFAKKSLAASFLALMITFAMLLGTTFAWFTDGVTSGNNIIASGNLNVNAYWMDGQLDPNGDNWTAFDDGSIFNYAKWEPGYAEAKHIKVANEGTLAFRFKLAIAPNGTVSELANVLDVYLYNNATQASRENLSNAECLGTLAEVMSKDVVAGVLLPQGTDANNANETVGSTTYTIVIKMREEAGNEYQGLSIGTDFDVRVLAAQYMFEEDSFGSDYDNDADYFNIVNTAEDLFALMAEGKNVMLGSDLNDVAVDTKAPYSNYYGIAQNGGIFDGNGHTLDFNEGLLHNGKLDNYGIMTSGGTIKNVTITGVFRAIVIMSPTEDVVIDNCTIVDEDVCYAVNTAEGNGQANIIIKNSTLAGWTSIGNTVKSVSFTNCTFAQGTYYNNVYGRLVKPYISAEFVNCDFCDMAYIDLSALASDATVTLDGCSINGVALTASNWISKIAPESSCGVGQISIEARNGSYMTSTNVLDYVVIK